MFVAFIPRPTKVVTLSAAANNINVFTDAGSPAYPLNLLYFINAAVGSSSNSTPAFRTGTGWVPGSFVYIQNSNTVTGGAGSPGTPGSTGSTEIGRAHV